MRRSLAEVHLADHFIEVSLADSKFLSSAKAVLSRNNLMSGFAIVCVLTSIAIWLAASKPGHQAPTPATKLPSRTQLNPPTEQEKSGAMKAILPQDLINSLAKGTH